MRTRRGRTKPPTTPSQFDLAQQARQRLDHAAANIKSARGRSGTVQMLAFREYEVALAIAQEWNVAGNRVAL